MKRNIFVLLMLGALLFTVSCTGKSNDDPQPGGTQPDDPPKSAAEEALGFDREDHQGAEFQVLLNNYKDFFDLARDFDISAEPRDKVEEETFNRNRACEEYLGITLKYTPENGGWNGTMHQTVDRLFLGGDQTYDMVVMGMNTGIMNGTVGSFANVLDMDSVNTGHGWWLPDLDENVAINGKLILLAGDSCISTYGYLGCVFTNLTVAEDYNLETDFYQMVRDHKWTLETFFTLASQISVDRDGSGAVEGESAADVFGWANCGTGVRAMWSSCGIDLVQRDSNGDYFWRETLDQRAIQMAQLLADVNQADWNFYFGRVENGAQTAFTQNRTLFLTYFLYMAQNLTDMEHPYAILPMPLYDSTQEDYRSVSISAHNALFFLQNTKDPSLSGKVAEFMGWYGSERIIPEYYDNALKYRYSNLENNIEMLELIRDTRTACGNELFGVIGNGVGILPLSPANTEETGFYSNPVSVYQNQSSVLNITLRKYLDEYNY